MSEALILPKRNKKLFSSISEFKCIKKIGKGAFSKVYLCVHKPSGKKYALKRQNLQKLRKSEMRNIRNEIIIHQSLDHPNIVKFYDYFIEKNYLFMVLEPAKDGNLFTYIKSNRNLEHKNIRKIFNQILDAVEYVHSKGVIIRDIKPENILKSGETYKLCDFGWSVQMDDIEWRKKKAGTCAYMSPESLTGKIQDFASDIWALGVLLYELHSRREPYTGRSCYSQLNIITHTVLKFNHPNFLTSSKNLINSILKFNAKKRPSVNDIRRHSYFSSNSVKGKRPKSKINNVIEYLKNHKIKCKDTENESVNTKASNDSRKNMFKILSP